MKWDERKTLRLTLPTQREKLAYEKVLAKYLHEKGMGVKALIKLFSRGKPAIRKLLEE